MFGDLFSAITEPIGDLIDTIDEIVDAVADEVEEVTGIDKRVTKTAIAITGITGIPSLKGE